jgi:predicted transcriptional regulator
MNSITELLDIVKVGDAMSPVKFTISPIQKLGAVAMLFQQNGIDAAPVVDETGKCMGILTNCDLVRFQAELPEMDSHIDGGMSFEAEHRQSDGCLELVQHPFDEVQRHMTRCLQTIDQASSLRLASRIMREQRIHHLIVLDNAQRPTGILSSLDILTKLDG